MLENVVTFTNSASRNHLILSSGCFEAINYVDVGYDLSSYIEPIIGDRRLSMRAQDKLNLLLRDNIGQIDDFGAYLAITNIGILFEPSLKIDTESLFDRWSQNNVLIVDIGKGIVSSNRLYLAPNCSEQYSVSLQKINYIIK